jgi:hypothetical protein
MLNWVCIIAMYICCCCIKKASKENCGGGVIIGAGIGGGGMGDGVACISSDFGKFALGVDGV